MTARLAAVPGSFWAISQVRPSQRRTEVPLSSLARAHTLEGEDAASELMSPRSTGKSLFVQRSPSQWKTVGRCGPSAIGSQAPMPRMSQPTAQASCSPVAMTCP
ncbi:hypothetical protein [Microbispora sp. H10885]|uniref:hypothetical protein n=1 Tax=Microbispora sp. H10885 TaxID=2729110 RepID=UPI0015FECB46|nr:hypothetical protein [Microbispora sp. H10885]